MVKLHSEGELFDGWLAVERGVLGSLLFVNGEQRVEFLRPTLHDLTEACERFDLDLDPIYDLIISAKDDVHTMMIDVPRYKANHPKVGDTAACQNCGTKIVFRKEIVESPSGNWMHARGYNKRYTDLLCDIQKVAEPEGVAK